ncbi:hypothetical protein [Sediminibacterium sp.]|uniref:hypothetical protein n=1 Tax=Sediminibacterium sp. TaxID=1917865 RepID=UPI0025EBFAE6|nr:hypothetical protein [Sediminibacterium sp.]
MAFPLMGFVLFHYQQKTIRAEMKQAFKSKELSTIRVDKLKWYKKDKEIVVNGTLFDVSTVTKQPDGTFIVKGLYDHQEQKLHQLLDKTTEKNQKSPLLVLYASCFVSNQSNFAFSLLQHTTLPANMHGAYFETLIPQFQPGILVPPPKGYLHA